MVVEGMAVVEGGTAEAAAALDARLQVSVCV